MEVQGSYADSISHTKRRQALCCANMIWIVIEGKCANLEKQNHKRKSGWEPEGEAPTTTLPFSRTVRCQKWRCSLHDVYMIIKEELKTFRRRNIFNTIYANFLGLWFRSFRGFRELIHSFHFEAWHPRYLRQSSSLRGFTREERNDQESHPWSPSHNCLCHTI